MVLQSSPMNSTKSREVIWGGRIITAAKINAEQARRRAVAAGREADRAGAHCVAPSNGGLRRAGATLTNHRPMPQRRLWRPPSLQGLVNNKANMEHSRA